MDRSKAKEVLAKELLKYRSKTYEELKTCTDGRVDAYSVVTTDGTEYQIEILVLWDGKEGGDIRVSGAIDDGGIRAFFPLSDSYIISPDGTFIDE